MKTERQRCRRQVVVGGILLAGALAAAGPAAADPAAPSPTPGATPAPGQPVLNATDGPSGPVAAPPIGAPPVPEIDNPTYGAGSTPGQLGYLRDIWHTFHSGNPLEALTMPPEEAPGAPPGAGPAPKLPPGYISLTDPSSSTPVVDTGPKAGGPALPPGYYPLNGPPPPGWYEQKPGSAPAAPAPGGPDAAPPPQAGFVATPSQ
ncbi:hypothetical protein BOO86_00455 [Mycobacterium sp. CBMA 234]|uniref:hypothetical protein n=1 Tax=Mycolicibacterium sp. CBMA 234 TaxID=1918495 RepID=UPI0012DE06F7|nr:hypothetical protein [Mycolicibacterium sp. CBMA 234]MUL62917.1 hypothetical protein [Mycolicibacterium sp. CBMA 234]